MVVIATYNAPEHLRQCVESILDHWSLKHDHDPRDPHDILIVGTCQGQAEIARKVVQGLRRCGIDIEVTETPWPHSGYDTGAYIWAYQNYVAASYLFLHDSCAATGSRWLQQFFDVATGANADVVPWCTFSPYLLGVTPDEERCIIDTYGLYGEPGYGFFGPIFWATYTALSEIEAAGYMKFVPSQKIHAQACERFWALYCARLGITVAPVHMDGFGTLYRGGQHSDLSKQFLRRQ